MHYNLKLELMDLKNLFIIAIIVIIIIILLILNFISNMLEFVPSDHL